MRCGREGGDSSDRRHHGSADRRFAGYILESGTPAYVQALEDSVISLMIEKRQAVEDLEDILSVKGVDMVTFGTNDYCMSIGKPGHARDPEIWEVHKYVYETALKKGVQPRAELGTPDDAKKFMDIGVKHFAIGTDLAILYGWWNENARALRDIIKG